MPVKHEVYQHVAISKPIIASQRERTFSRALTSSPQRRRKRWTPERVKGEQHLFSFPHIPSLQLRPTPGPGAALRALAGGGKSENYKWQLHFYSGGGWRGEEGWMDRWGKWLKGLIVVPPASRLPVEQSSLSACTSLSFVLWTETQEHFY